MALAIDDTTVARWTASNNDFDGDALTATSASFTPASGSLLVLVVNAGEADTNRAGSASVSGGGLTWTKRQENGSAFNGGGTNTEAYVAIWTAPVVTGASMTVAATVGWADNFSDYDVSCKLYIVTGQHASPIGQSNKGGPTSDSGTGISPTMIASTTGIGRMFFGGTERNGGSGSPGLPVSSDTEDAAYISTILGALAAYKASNHAASAAVTGNLDGAGATVWNWVALEILEASGSTTGTATPSQATLTINGKLPSANAFSTVTIREVMINEAGSPVSNRTGISLLVWYAGNPVGAPDLSLSALTTDAAGTASWSLAPGGLTYNQPIFYVATDGGTSLSVYTCGRMVPIYL
jgi:hypothetical protein